jgi:hypothetical protein
LSRLPNGQAAGGLWGAHAIAAVSFAPVSNRKLNSDVVLAGAHRCEPVLISCHELTNPPSRSSNLKNFRNLVTGKSAGFSTDLRMRRQSSKRGGASTYNQESWSA